MEGDADLTSVQDVNEAPPPSDGFETFESYFWIFFWSFAALTSILLVFKYCGMTVHPPQYKQLYRNPPSPPSKGWFWQGGAPVQPKPPAIFEMLPGVVLPIGVNWQLTEVIVRNPHVFVLFGLPQPFCPSSNALLETIVGLGRHLATHRDKIPRIIVAANCSLDSSMATNHKVTQFPTIAYYRYGYYYCDYCGEKTGPEMFRFFVTIVAHKFPNEK